MSSYNDILYAGRAMAIGSFDCPATAPDFANTGPASDYLLAFPQTAVKIRQLGNGDTIVADPNIVTIYNKGQEYERGRVSDYGDRCDWLAFDPECISEALKDIGVQHSGDPERLFTVCFGRSPASIYALLRQLTTRLRHETSPDAVAVEETAMHILSSILAHAYANQPARTTPGRSATVARHKKQVRQLVEILATRYNESLSLELLAREVNSSAYHLSRVFRRITGSTIHRYLVQLRLRHALAYLAHADTDLATLAVDAGFTDHSHFAKYFRQSFASTPSQFRASLTQ